MTTMGLKNGEKMTVEIWDIERLKQYMISIKLPVLRRGETRHFEGFHYFGPRLINDLEEYPRETYASEKDLSLLERQEERGLPNEKYHRSIVALKNDELIGIRVCQWIKDRHFWRYHTKFLDVNENFRNMGVATNLTVSLDTAPFLENKILQLGLLSPDGRKYLKRAINDHLLARNYALISSDYCLVRPPTTIGIFDDIGRRMN